MHTLKVSLRDGDDTESNLWMAEDAANPIIESRKNILIVDDINDSGATLNWIMDDWASSCAVYSDDDWKEKMKLVFSPTKSLYTYLNDQGESEDGTWAWRNDELIITRDFEKEKKTEVIEMLGKTYIVDDSLHTPKWKVMNQIKDVAGYICMKAVTEDTVKKQKITAWFAGDIPVSAGPERYFGLPGVILELDINEGDVVITATKVEFKKLDKELIMPKTKGKKIKDADYDALLRNHLKDSIKSQRNPYWAIRY
jgi:GLPGLI family protein